MSSFRTHVTVMVDTVKDRLLVLNEKMRYDKGAWFRGFVLMNIYNETFRIYFYNRTSPSSL